MSRELVEKLYDIFQEAANDTDVGYATRFTVANTTLSKEEFLAKWDADAADRAEAAKVEEHRKAKVLNDFMASFGVEGNAIANLVGAEAVSKASSFAEEPVQAGDPDVGSDSETN